MILPVRGTPTATSKHTFGTLYKKTSAFKGLMEILAKSNYKSIVKATYKIAKKISLHNLHSLDHHID